MNQLNVCAKCKQIKSASDFCIDKQRKSGLQSWCKTCKAAWARRYYQTDKGKLAHNRSRRQKITPNQLRQFQLHLNNIVKYYTKKGGRLNSPFYVRQQLEQALALLPCSVR